MLEKDIDLITHIKNLLKRTPNGLNRFKLLHIGSEYYYFTANQIRWTEVVLVKVSKENFASEHYFRGLEESEWNELYTEEAKKYEKLKR